MVVRGWSRRLTTKEPKQTTFGDDENVLYLDCDSGTRLYTFVKTHQVVHLKLLNYILCKKKNFNKAN